MIVTLTAGRTSFFHDERAYPASLETVKSSSPAQRRKIQAAATIATAACCSPQNAANMDYISNCASENPVYRRARCRRPMVKTRKLMTTCLSTISPLGWEHINLTGDYVWRQNRRVESGKFRPLDQFPFLNVRFFPFREVKRLSDLINSCLQGSRWIPLRSLDPARHWSLQHSQRL
jgi:hypothetical protein